MSRWKVKSVDYDTFRLWFVFEGKHSPLSGILEWHERCDFSTWAQAIEYADRRARTVEVTLPRLTVLPTGRHAVLRNGLIIEYASSGFYPHLRAGHITVEPEERRALALALLAIAQHKEEA